MRQILDTTLSVAQAAISVLLVIGYGALAQKYNILTLEGERDISHLDVTLFLPALLFSQIGPQATISNLASDWIIVVLAIWFQLVSYVVGVSCQKLFKLPQWVVPCVVFNNTTALPLLLFDNLESQGVLDDFMKKGDSRAEVSRRARNYILVNAVVCNPAKFMFGPLLMSSRDPIDRIRIFSHYETTRVRTLKGKHQDRGQDQSGHPDEAQPLLADNLSEHHDEVPRPEKERAILLGVWGGIKSVLNPPLMGGVAGVILGIIPFLHKLVFGEHSPLASVTGSIKDLGKLYSALQTFVLGGQLYSKRGSNLDSRAFALIMVWRFAGMPVASISTVYFLRKHNVMKSDPVLDFILAILPVGPPGISLAAIADMSDISSQVVGSVGCTLMYSYIVAPIISLPITAAWTVIKDLHKNG